jgi:hypothetical protein
MSLHETDEGDQPTMDGIGGIKSGSCVIDGEIF